MYNFNIDGILEMLNKWILVFWLMKRNNFLGEIKCKTLLAEKKIITFLK